MHGTAARRRRVLVTNKVTRWCFFLALKPLKLLQNCRTGIRITETHRGKEVFAVDKRHRQPLNTKIPRLFQLNRALGATGGLSK